jgi:hypothetical protein
MKHLIFLVLLFPYYILLGQNVKSGSPYPNSKDDYRAYIKNGTQHIVLKATRKSTQASLINHSSLSSLDKNNPLKHPKLMFSLEKVFSLGDKNYAFYTYFDTKYSKLFARNISLEPIGISDKLIEVVSIERAALTYGLPGYVKVNPYYIGNKGYFQLAQWGFKISQNKDKILCARFAPGEDKSTFFDYQETELNLVLSLFDANLKEIWTKEISAVPSSLKGEDISIAIQDFNFDVKNNAYLTGFASQGSKNTKVELYKIPVEGKSTLIPFPSTKYTVRKAWTRQGHDGRMKCIIAYSKDPERSNIEVLALGDIEYDKITNLSYVEFKPSFYNKTNKVWIGNQGTSTALFASDLIEFLPQPDGTFICLLEFKYLSIGGNVANLRDNVIAKFEVDNTSNWVNVLPKNQQGALSDVNRTGSKYIKGEDAHFVFFIDSPKSKTQYTPDIHPEKFSVKNQKGILAYYKINDSSGATSKHQIFNVDGKSIPNLYLSKLIPYDSKHVLLETQITSKEEALIKIELK